MFKAREEIENEEVGSLAPFAAKSAESLEESSPNPNILTAPAFNEIAPGSFIAQPFGDLMGRRRYS